MKNFNDQLVLVATVTLSLVTITYSIVFSFQLSSSPLIGILLAVMMVGFNILEFSMITFLGRFIATKSVLPIFLSIVVVISGLMFSVFANIWVVSDSYAQYTQERKVTADSYKGWEANRDNLTKQVDELRATAIPASIAQSNLDEAIIKQEEILNARAYNSNNANTGRSVGDLTGNCSRQNYYHGKYCGEYQTIQTVIKTNERALLDSQKLVALEERLAKTISAPPVSSDVHAPGIKTMTNLSGVEPDKIMSLLSFWLAVFNELGAIFGWFVIGTSKKPVKINDNNHNDDFIDGTYTEIDTKNTLPSQDNSMTGYIGSDDNSAEIRAVLSAKLKRLLAKMDTSSSSLAKSLGIPQATFSEYVNGKRIPPVTALIKLKKHLHGSFNIEKFLDTSNENYK